MGIESELMENMKQAMRAKDKRTLDVLRMVKAKALERKTAASYHGGDLTDQDWVEVIQAYVKSLQKSLPEFEKAGVRGVVLDMRDNPGGLLTAAVEVADAFLKSGVIVSTVGTSSPREDLAADDRYDFADVPVVVLIDQGSASA